MLRKLLGRGSVDKYREQTPEARGYLRPLKVEELLNTENAQKLLKQIRDNSLMTREGTERYYLQSLRQCVNLMQQLPLTEKEHHAVAGGLVDFTLKTVAYALRLSRGQMLPKGSGAEKQSAQAATWNAVIFYAALCRSLTVFGQLEGELSDGTPWYPGLVVPSKPYRLRFCEGREERAKTLAVLLGMRLLPEEVVVWLGRTPVALDTLLRIIRGEAKPGCAVLAIISKASELAGGPPAENGKSSQQDTLAPVVAGPLASAVQPEVVIPSTGEVADGNSVGGMVPGREPEDVTAVLPSASVAELQTSQLTGDLMSLIGLVPQPELCLQEGEPGPDVSAMTKRNEEPGGEETITDSCGEQFWQWLRNGIRNGTLSVNNQNSLIHITGGMIFIPTPEIFFDFLKNFSEITSGTSKTDVQREFEKLGRNFCRKDNALFQCRKYEEKNRQGRYKKWAGYLIKARQIYTGEEVPGDSLYLFISMV